MVLVKLTVTSYSLQLINTSISTFFSELRAFLAEQRRPVMVERKLDGAVDESSRIKKFTIQT